MSSRSFEEKVAYLKPYLDCIGVDHEIDLAYAAHKFGFDLAVAQKGLLELIDEGYIFQYVSENTYRLLSYGEPRFPESTAVVMVKDMSILYLKQVEKELTRVQDPVVRNVLENLRRNLLMYSDLR